VGARSKNRELPFFEIGRVARQSEPSFSNAIAAVRRLFWSAPNFPMSRHTPDRAEFPAVLWESFTEAICYGA